MDNADTNIVILLVGNKSDLEDRREVSFEKAQQYAEKRGMAFIETSALDSSNVEQAFEQVIQRIHDQVQRQLRQLEVLLDRRLANTEKALPNSHQELLEELYSEANSSGLDQTHDAQRYAVYSQQQLNRITGGAYIARQQRLIQNAKVSMG